MSLQLSVGYDGKIDNLKNLLNCSDKIKEVYTGGAANIIRTGRPQYCKSLKDIEKQVKYAFQKGVKFSLALNAPCNIPETSNKNWWRKTREYINDIEKMGINGVIVSHPFLINEIKLKTKLKICISTICEIMSARSALFYEQMGADEIVPSMNLNYNLSELSLVKKVLTRAKLKIMVNEHCLGDCPWRRFHHNHYSYSNSEKDFHIKCLKSYYSKPYRFLTNNVIRPEDLSMYKSICSKFKIVGRTLSNSQLISIVKAYSNQSFNGNYLSLFHMKLSKYFFLPNKELVHLFKHKKNCNCDCNECTYCINLYKSILIKQSNKS
jgi:collagenase-like PrtC family protease